MILTSIRARLHNHGPPAVTLTCPSTFILFPRRSQNLPPASANICLFCVCHLSNLIPLISRVRQSTIERFHWRMNLPYARLWAGYKKIPGSILQQPNGIIVGRHRVTTYARMRQLNRLLIRLIDSRYNVDRTIMTCRRVVLRSLYRMTLSCISKPAITF